MKKCPECNTECADNSPCCPKCYYLFTTNDNKINNKENNNLNSEEQKNTEKNIDENKDKKGNDPCVTTCGIGCLIIIIIIGLFTLIYVTEENRIKNSPDSYYNLPKEQQRAIDEEVRKARENDPRRQKIIEQNIYNMQRAKQEEELKHALELEENYQKSKRR